MIQLGGKTNLVFRHNCVLLGQIIKTSELDKDLIRLGWSCNNCHGQSSYSLKC